MARKNSKQVFDKLKYTNIALEHMRHTVKDETIANSDIKILFKKRLRDMTEGGKSVYVSMYGEHICDWIENNVKHLDKDWIDKPFILSPFQVTMLCIVYGLREKHDTTLRYWHHIKILAARKTGKTMFGASIMAYHMAFSKPNDHYYTLAVNQRQSKILWEMTAKIIRKIPKLGPHVKVQAHIAKMTHVNEATCEALTKNIDGNEGLSPSVVFFDEAASYKDSDIIDTITTGMGVIRNKLSFTITTATTNKDGVFIQRFRDSLITMREDKEGDSRTLAFNYALDEEDDPWDPTLWIKANPNLGTTTELKEMIREADEAKRSTLQKIAFFTKKLNKFVANVMKWWAVEEFWENRISKEAFAELLENRDLIRTVGVDMSQKHDLTSLVSTYFNPADDTYYVTHKCFHPHSSLDLIDAKLHGIFLDAEEAGYYKRMPEKVISQVAIANELLRMHKEYPISEALFDKHHSDSVVERIGGIINTRVIPQNMPTLSPFLRRTEELVGLGRIKVIDDPFFFWQLNNVVIYAGDNSMMKIQAPGRSNNKYISEKIDSISAMIDSFAFEDFKIDQDYTVEELVSRCF